MNFEKIGLPVSVTVECGVDRNGAWQAKSDLNRIGNSVVVVVGVRMIAFWINGEAKTNCSRMRK